MQKKTTNILFVSPCSWFNSYLTRGRVWKLFRVPIGWIKADDQILALWTLGNTASYEEFISWLNSIRLIYRRDESRRPAFNLQELFRPRRNFFVKMWYLFLILAISSTLGIPFNDDESGERGKSRLLTHIFFFLFLMKLSKPWSYQGFVKIFGVKMLLKGGLWD